jgi:hypothetical protein
MDPTAISTPPTAPSTDQAGADRARLDAYATGHALMTDHTLGALLERLRVQYTNDRDVGEALRGAVDALLDVAIDCAEPREGVIGYLMPGDASGPSWRYFCAACVPAHARQIESRVFADSEIAGHGSCVQCAQALHATTAVA